MKRRTLLCGLSLLVLGLAAAAPPPEARPGGEQSAGPRENLTAWEWYAEVPLPAGARPALCDLVVPPPIFNRAKPDLADLRLIDQQGRPVPYALRVLRGETELRTLDARVFNRANPDTGVAELTLDLGPSPPEYNSITINTDGTNYRRAVRLEGSDDEKNWRTILDQVWLLHFGTETGVVDQRRFGIPPARFRYLRVRVTRDRSLPNDEPKLLDVQVQWMVRVAGETQTLPVAQLEPRQPVPGIGGPGSAWFIDLGDSVPVEKLTFDVADDHFVRPFKLELANPGESPLVVAQGEWRRQVNDGRKPLEVTFSEVVGRRFRLVVTDYRNPPLSILGATWTQAVRQVIFAPPADLAGQPLKLHVGNPKAEPPHYDFASTLPARLDPAPVRVSVGNPLPNPDYRPQQPWTERMPWLVDAVLAGAAAVLLGVLLMLARSAISYQSAIDSRRRIGAPTTDN